MCGKIIMITKRTTCMKSQLLASNITVSRTMQTNDYVCGREVQVLNLTQDRVQFLCSWQNLVFGFDRSPHHSL